MEGLKSKKLSIRILELFGFEDESIEHPYEPFNAEDFAKLQDLFYKYMAYVGFNEGTDFLDLNIEEKYHSYIITEEDKKELERLLTLE